MEYEKTTLFGDHTLSLYKTKSPFFVASDGLKILYSEKMDGYFYYYLLEKYKPESEGYKRHFSILKECECAFPKSSDEQKKIGQYFDSLDNLITLHQRQYYCLCINQKVWKQRKLGELYEVNNERNKDLIGYDKTFSIATMTYKDEGNGAADSSLANYKVLRIGDIAFEGHTNKEFRYGRFVANDVGDGIMSPRFSTLRPINEMPVSFWKYYIHYEPIMRKILVCSTKAGTMMNELVPSDFFAQDILVPSIEEQTKIGEYFQNLDNLITLHRRMFHTKERRTYK